MPPGRNDVSADSGERLANLDDRYRLLVEQVTEYALFLLDASGRVVTWNRGAERIKQYRADEIIGQHFSKFYRPEDLWKCDRELEVAAQEGKVEDEGWRVRKDGSLFWANVVITALRNSVGNLLGYAKVTRDLTDRRRAEERLRASDERFRLLVEGVKDYAIFMLDPRGCVASWNIGAERIKGYRANEIIGQYFARFYPEEDVRAGKCEMELERASRDGRFEDEGWRVRKDGTRFWANVVITALHSNSGEVLGFAKVTRDLTERRAAELERLQLGHQARERIHALAGLAEALASAITLAEVGQAAAEQGTGFVQADSCTLYQLDEHDKSLQLVAQRGCDPVIVDAIRTIAPDSSDPLYAIGGDGGAALWVENHEQYAAVLPELARTHVEGQRAQAFACLPLIAEGRSVGMLGLGFYEARTFSEDEREFVTTFARQCAEAVARARRWQAERASASAIDRLRASYSTTLRSIGDAVIATDPRGAVTLMNGVAESLTGFSEAEARGRLLPEVFHIINEQTRVVVANPVDKVLATGGVVGLANHTVLIARDGSEVAIDDSGAPIRGEDGGVEGVVLVFRDVSERKREESRRAFLAEAMSTLSESIDYEQTVAKVARLAVPLLADWCAVDVLVEGQPAPRRLAAAHVDPTKIELTKELDEKYPPRADAPAGVPNVLRTGRSELYPEISDDLLVASCVDAEHLRLARSLGQRSAVVVPLVVHDRVLGAMTFVFAESGRRYTEHDLAVAEDLARRCANAIENARLYRSERQARQAADVANRAKDDFLAVVSHELRTPLNAIMGWSKMLTKSDLDERRRQTAIETIGRNAVAMAQLIEDLLDTSRVISGKLSLQLQKVDISRIVVAALEAVRPAAAGRGVELTTDLDENVPAMVGDPTRLQQIIWNLLTNAIKFSATGGRVAVTLKVLGASVQISVKDSGQGIAPAFLPYVFEPFRQQDASSSRAHGGLGLGLAISRQLTELQGGRITAQSEGEGRGATFTVTLPLSGATSDEALPLRASRQLEAGMTFDAPQHLRGLHVLVVDDDDDARQLIATILEDCGCRLSLARSAHEAMTRLADEVPDLLLSDIGMPGEDGYSLIRKVRDLPRERGGGIPAAAITAYARPEDRRRMLNAGYSIHLPKPVEPAELIAVVSTLSRFIHP
jgi:PAS domain S-box-containing protein